MKRYLSKADLAVIIITGILFTMALFTKGMTHDLLLEAGVLLVSAKIIMMNFKNSVSVTRILKELDDIKKTLTEIKDADGRQ